MATGLCPLNDIFFFHFNSFKNDKKTLIGDDVTRELLAIMRPDVEQMPD